MGRGKKSSKELWEILMEGGQIRGPLQRETVLQMIREGQLRGLGGEYVRRYSKDQEWTPLSGEPIFYDLLLETFEKGTQPSPLPPSPSSSSPTVSPSSSHSSSEPHSTTDSSSPPQSLQQGRVIPLPLEGTGEPTPLAPVPSTSPSSVSPQSSPYRESISGPVLDLLDLKSIKKRSQRRRIQSSTGVFFFLGILAVGLIVLGQVGSGGLSRGLVDLLRDRFGESGSWLISGLGDGGERETEGQDPHRPGFHLISPRSLDSTGASVSEQEALVHFQKSTHLFFTDSVQNYLEAQNELILIIEGYPKMREAHGLLCLVYRELWPFVNQDSEDLEALSALAQRAKILDPIGSTSSYCDLSKLLILGKLNEAKGMVNYLLGQTQFATDPVLFALRAELLGMEMDYNTAVLYLAKAVQYQPQWVKPRFLLGLYQEKLKKESYAFRVYEDVIKMNPRHKESYLQMGGILNRFYHNPESALKYLTLGLKIPDWIRPRSEAQGHQELAQILRARGNLASALSHAQRALELDPFQASLRQLVVQLGGTPSRRVSGSGGIRSSSSVEGGRDGVSGGENNGILNGSRSGLILLGDEYVRVGELFQAQIKYKAAFQTDPKNGLAAMKIAQTLWRMHNTQEALRWLQKAIAADPRLIDAYILMADYLSQRFDYKGASEILGKASSLASSKRGELLRGYGLLEYRRNNFKDAIAYLERSLRIYDRDPEVLILLAKAYGAGAYGQKAEALQSALRTAQGYALQAIETDSTNSEAQIVYSNILSQMKGLDSGIYYLKDLIEKFSYSMDFRLALGNLYRGGDRMKEARQVYEQILNSDPKNKEALMGLAQTLQGLGEFEKANPKLLQASLLDLSDGEPLFILGQIRMKLAKYQEAISYFRKAIAANPHFPNCYQEIARAAFLMEDYQLSLSSAQEEQKRNPGLVEPYLIAADCYVALKQYKKCTQQYQTILKMNPSGASIYVKAAHCYRLNGNLDVASTLLNLAIAQESGWPDIYKEQGNLFQRTGDLSSAETSLRKYLELSPNAPDRKAVEAQINGLYSSSGTGED